MDESGKTRMRSKQASGIVTESMNDHCLNATIQSDGCVVLSNLAMDASGGFANPVTEVEVDAVLDAILLHESLVL